jgi:hypothetical protein
MGDANLFHSLGGRKTAQTQQHTVFESVKGVSLVETLFHPCAKLRAMKQFVSVAIRQKGAGFSTGSPVKTKVPL